MDAEESDLVNATRMMGQSDLPLTNVAVEQNQFLASAMHGIQNAICSDEEVVDTASPLVRVGCLQSLGATCESFVSSIHMTDTYKDGVT